MFSTIVGRGIGVVLHAWNTCFRGPMGEADIGRERDLIGRDGGVADAHTPTAFDDEERSTR